jgi:flavin reductase (DIM6/NTAB) family NADH-FMN oxidoreductase RutF
MRNHAGGVTVITTGSLGERTGLTATAVCSLSDNPPSLVACVNRSASAYCMIKETGSFCVNLLAEDQGNIANCFAGRAGLKRESRFTVGLWTHLVTGAPALVDAVANFDCRLVNEQETNTHAIFIGLVQEVRMNKEAKPLIYVRGTFSAAHPLFIKSGENDYLLAFGDNYLGALADVEEVAGPRAKTR